MHIAMTNTKKEANQNATSLFVVENRTGKEMQVITVLYLNAICLFQQLRNRSNL